MDLSAFSSLPDAARVWIYGADRPLDPGRRTRLLDAVQSFLDSWTSHGRRVHGRAELLHDRFLVLAGEVAGGDLSGCGIDASTHAVEEAAAALGIGWAPGMDVFYRDASGAVQQATRAEFRTLVRSGAVRADTTVFDLTPDTLGALRSGGIERRAGASWHGRTFRIPDAEPSLP